MNGALVRRPLRRLVLLASSAALVTSGALVAPAQAATPQATSSTTWLSSELDRQLPFEQFGQPSWGPTLDSYFAMSDLDVRAAKRKLILNTLEDDVESYISFEGDDIAGAIAKTLSAVQADGRSTDTYAGGGLVERLEAQIEPAGAEEGRVHEYYDDGQTVTDYSNSLDQGWAVRALAGAESDDAGRALDFLLQQQCEDGYFRESMATSNPCDTAPSVDTTAFAVLSIVTARRDGVGAGDAEVSAALARAGRWLVSTQAENGGFAGVGPVSADSTGLAARALLALGRDRAAERAATWLQGRQVTAELARRTAIAKRDVGAIAPTVAAFKEAKREGIAASSRINWRLATGQAAAGLDALR